jgi:ribosomal protein S18 acetylase RimI-like enzyme
VRARCAQIIRRPARAADDSYLHQLFAESRDELLALPPDFRASLLDMQYSGQARQFAADHPAATREILVADGVDSGVLVLDRDAERIHILDITIARSARRQGIASSALRAVIDEAGARSVTLCVWSGNLAARSLYERLGFVASASSHPGSDFAEGYLSMERKAVR